MAQMSLHVPLIYDPTLSIHVNCGLKRRDVDCELMLQQFSYLYVFSFLYVCIVLSVLALISGKHHVEICVLV